MASPAFDEPLPAVAEAQGLAAILLSIGLMSAVPKVAWAGVGTMSDVADTMVTNVVVPAMTRGRRLLLMCFS
jgi:hypothetical protein